MYRLKVADGCQMFLGTCKHGRLHPSIEMEWIWRAVTPCGISLPHAVQEKLALDCTFNLDVSWCYILPGKKNNNGNIAAFFWPGEEDNEDNNPGNA